MEETDNFLVGCYLMYQIDSFCLLNCICHLSSTGEWCFFFVCKFI